MKLFVILPAASALAAPLLIAGIGFLLEMFLPAVSYLRQQKHIKLLQKSKMEEHRL